LARKKANEDDFQRTFAPVFVGIASALSFDPNSEPGAIALSSAKTQFIRDYISMMPLRAKDWTIEKADKLATDELIRAIRYLQEKIEPEPDELQES
jgi:hypothetical protein